MTDDQPRTTTGAGDHAARHSRPAQPGEVCTCGHPAVDVLVGDGRPSIGSCGVERPATGCVWECGNVAAHPVFGPCPLYRLNPEPGSPQRVIADRIAAATTEPAATTPAEPAPPAYAWVQAAWAHLAQPDELRDTVRVASWLGLALTEVERLAEVEQRVRKVRDRGPSTRAGKVALRQLLAGLDSD